MQSLLKILSDIVGQSFDAEGLPAEFGAVKVSDRPDLAQFQCNGAMAAAKAAKKNPRAVAEAVVARLFLDKRFSKVEIAGPGFINLVVADDVLAGHVMAMAADENLGVAKSGVGETIVLDYGGPNIAKAMHVGHLRASIIGDSLRRLLKFCGYNALGDVHMGDWGTPMGMVISELALRHPEWPYFDESFTGPYPETSPVSMNDLEEIYPTAANACKADEDRMNAARAATAALQDGRPGYRALWSHFMTVSIAGMKVNFDALNVHFDLWKGEADVHDLIAPMVADLKHRGFAVKDDGAIVIPVKRSDDDRDLPPLILYKRDGAVMYGTTDLATVLDRVKNMSPARLVYVVDQRQSLHFEQIFRAARLSGIAPDALEMTHAGFGTMNGPDGKPFKTRAGGVLKLEDLIATAIEKARDRMKEAGLAADMDEAQLAGIARMVGVAAIKFADLQNPRISDYIFDLDRMTAFEGKTGPYILYQIVRIKSVLRNLDDEVAARGGPVVMGDEDRKLALLLTELPEAIDGALRNYQPHIVCDYAYRLANGFSSFYGNCHIKSEPDPALKASRVTLCRMVLAQLECVFGLLGIDIPDRM